jgi:hypothetical protein
LSIVHSLNINNPYVPRHTLEKELRLPDLECFEFGPLPELDSFDESITSNETPLQEPDEDLWEAALELGPANKDVIFYTWETFETPNHVERQTTYITERGSEAYDVALVADDSKVSAGRVVKGDVLLQSLLNLGLGRSSILFNFNRKLKTFESAIPDGRASGVSLRAAQSLIAQLIHIGNTFLYLRSFAERTFASPSSIPARVALATSMTSILSTLEDHLGRQSRNITTLIQLQHHFAKPRDILGHVARMVDATEHAKNNEQLASILHHRLLEIEEGDDDIRRLSSRILYQVAVPTLELLGEWIGIKKEQDTMPIASRGSFVTTESDTPDDVSVEYSYRSEMMPRFISPEDGNTIFETGNSLRFLRTQHPDHPLVNLQMSDITIPDFGWAFLWQDIEAISTKARKYEEDLRQILLAYSKGEHMRTTSALQSGGDLPEQNDVVNLDQYFEDSMRQLDAAPQQRSQFLPDEVQIIMEDVLYNSNAQSIPSHTFAPPLSLSSTLSFRPLITAQSKLVNAATLRLFYRSHHLRHHLSLQWQYHLLGDGVFSSLLATALFDPNRESAERQKGKMRSGVHMGLQLGSRTSWPPASSELRLALKGVLSESYYSSALYHSSSDVQRARSSKITARDNDELPGQLNFAIRNLTEAEQENVMDPDALSALDFLRLQYVPPVPLNLIITTASLDKYDLIFKFLLRLLRMLFVVSHIPRGYADVQARQFRLEAHHFVTVLANYVFQTGIAEPWNAFDALVATIEARIDDEDAAGEYGTRVTEGIASLRDAHEQCLDSILFALLLRKRQCKVMALVEDIFDHILLFAKMQQSDAQAQESLNDVHSKLHGKIRVFLRVCRSLTGKRGYGSGKGTAEENTMERLVLGLEVHDV